MPLTKNIATARVAAPAAEASYRYFLSDAKDDGPGDHPLCLCCEVTLHPSDVQSVFLENVTRDGTGRITGRVPVAPFTLAQINGIRTGSAAVHAVAAAAAGYANTP